MSVLIVGTVALDTIKTPVGKVTEVLGGSAVFSSVAANMLAPVNLIAVVGKDFPKKYITNFKLRGIDIKGLEIVDGETFRWEGEYDWDFSNAKTLNTHLNVLAGFNPKVPQEYKKNKYVFLANIDPAAQEKVLSQMEKPQIVLCDTMNYWITNKYEDLLKVFKRVDIALVNETEARQLTGANNLTAAAKLIKRMGPKSVIIKKGENGALVYHQNKFFSVPGYLLEKVVDPTGAGDTFAGGIIGYIAASGKITDAVLRSAVIYGCVMAAFTCEDFSLKKIGRVTGAEVKIRLQSYKKLTSWNIKAL